MSDPRITPANGRVAAQRLKGKVYAKHFTVGYKAHVQRPLVDLLDIEGGQRDRQLLCGTPVTVYEDHDGWAFIESDRDGYVGYVLSAALAKNWEPTHRVTSLTTHAYRRPDIKSTTTARLSLGATLPVTKIVDCFAETPLGHVPAVHLSPIDHVASKPIDIAKKFLRVPYLWGGNSSDGIDCSGLVQAAHLACGIPCPGDSDLQEKGIGTALAGGSVPKTGDLFFWTGHVAMVADADQLIHANAFHMAVSFEPISEAIKRIGPVRTHKRLVSVHTADQFSFKNR